MVRALLDRVIGDAGTLAADESPDICDEDA
jgi:hypothetical protein